MGSHTIRSRFAKVVVTFERREDGGLRAYSNDVPGFVLSNKDPDAVIRDVAPALEFILSAMWGTSVKADLLPHVGDEIDDALGMSSSSTSITNHAREYVAHVSQ